MAVNGNSPDVPWIMKNKVAERGDADASKRLTESSHWNSRWISAQSSDPEIPPPGRYRKIAERFIGPARLKQYLDGCHHFLWYRLLPRFVSANRSGQVLELGSAPGEQVLRFHELFDYAPYGVEYTAAGAELNRQNFEAHGIDPAHVFEADAFSASFQAEHRERFDAVMSWGLIEHFTDPESAVSAHVNVLKPGGLLIISIPNLCGFNHWQVRHWAADLLPLHNLAIMQPARFRSLFMRPDLDQLFCAPVGGVHVLMGDVNGSIPPRLLGILRRIQLVINVLQSSIGAVESRWWSPYLVYIGRKR